MHVQFVNDISIHALREESDEAKRDRRMDFHISIHALREESDNHRYASEETPSYFNPRSP